MIWSDADIWNALRWGMITVDPPPFPGVGGPVQPASLELTLAQDVQLLPGEFRLAHTVEVVSLGAAVAAQLNGKSSLARIGLMVHSTGGWIDPGFSGQIVLELKNIQPMPRPVMAGRGIELKAGQRVAQLVFHPLKTMARKPYGHPDLDSHYQGQRGTVGSHLET